MFLNLYVDMYAANLWPSVGSLAPGVWPAELTHHLPAVLACCLLRQQGVVCVRPLDAPRSLSASSDTSAWLALTHPQLTAVQGSLSPSGGEIASVRVFVSQTDTPLTLCPSVDVPTYQPSTFPIPQTFELVLQALLQTIPANCFSVPLKSFCTSFQCLLPSPSS